MLILTAKMISITKQLKAATEPHAIRVRKQQSKTPWRPWDDGRQRTCQRCGCNEAPFQLLLLLLVKILTFVALMPNATKLAATTAIQTTTLLSIISTTEAAATETIKAHDSKAYETMKPAAAGEMAMAMNASATDATTDAPTDFTARKKNEAKQAAISHHVAATASTYATSSSGIIPTNTTTAATVATKANITTTYIKRNTWTNMTAKQSKSRLKIYNSGNENILANDPTAAFMASTIAITTPAAPIITTALAVLTAKTTTATTTNNVQRQLQSEFQRELFGTPKDTSETTSATPLPTTMYTSSIYMDLIDLSSTLSPLEFMTLPPNSTNMSFHQHCMTSRDSFANLITIVLYSIVCIIGLFGNTLVIYVVLRFSKMQTVTNIYILNLAIADECFLIGIPFLLYTMRICSWTFGEYMCKAYMVSTSITQFTSSIFLLIMSADRFIAVCHPIASPRYRTLHIAKYVSALAWLTSAVLMLPVILFASTVAQEDGVHYSCNIEWPERYKKHSGTTFILYTFLLGFATPLCFILCFYYLVIKKLHAVGRKHKSKEKKRSHRKVTRLVLTVITVYIMCWLPQWISQVALISSNPAQRDLSRIEVLIFLLLGCLAYSNSAMNPILYAFLSDNFRKSFSKAFTCMAGHEVNAQLQLEPSVFTKHGGSRRRSSKRSVAQATPKTKATLHTNPTLGNNNSSTTTSSTATQNDRNVIAVCSGMGAGMTSTTTTTLTTSTGNSLSLTVPPFHATINGRAGAENVMLVLDKEESVCATVIERRKSSKHHSPGNALQTDL